MGPAEPARRIRPEDRVPGHSTPGMTREEAFATEAMWAGVARTAPGGVSAWHHHGEYQTTIFVARGRLRMESGPGGSAVEEAVVGDFVYVPPFAIHRESNPGDEESTLVLVRAGTGPVVVNVDGPAPG
jgi:uncharacterized RmlC-like cupin family protein